MRMLLGRVPALATMLATLLAACSFPEPSGQFACDTTADCDDGRACEGGYCVVSSNPTPDGAPTPDTPAPMPDADPGAALAALCLAKGYTLAAGPNGYYRTGIGTKSWLAAQTECAADVPGKSHLIVLSVAAEVTFLAAQPGWIGLSDRTLEDTFVTVTSETGDQRPFASGQPDNGSGNEDCVRMRSGAELDDDQCGNTHPYVCECDGRMSTP